MTAETPVIVIPCFRDGHSSVLTEDEKTVVVVVVDQQLFSDRIGLLAWPVAQSPSAIQAPLFAKCGCSLERLFPATRER